MTHRTPGPDHDFRNEDTRRKALESRKKLHPPPARKKDIVGERRRIIEETTERIKTLLASDEISYKELAELLDMTQGHVSHLLSGSRNMTLITLADIGEALGYRFSLIPHKIEEQDK